MPFRFTATAFSVGSGFAAFCVFLSRQRFCRCTKKGRASLRSPFPNHSITTNINLLKLNKTMNFTKKRIKFFHYQSDTGG